MKKIVSLFSLLLILAEGFSQSTYFTISGKITDAVTKAPLQAASVFAQNTTFGTATDAEGNFTLYLPNGGYDLVVTYTGYETETKRISTTDADNKNIFLELKQKEKSMEVVAIVSSNEVKDGWEKYGYFFKDNFIGSTPFSQNCVLLNQDSLKFYFSKRKNRLKVLANTPLEIQNNALGYKIKYTLDSFTYEYATQTATYSGYPLFEEMQPTDIAQQELWKQNRLNAYNGSILHFMRSVYSKNLKKEGFEIQFVTKNNDIENAITLKDFYGAINYSKDDSTQTVDFSPNQPDMAVLYKKEEPAAEYIAQNDDSPKKFQLSILSINPSHSIVIEQNGYYYDQDNITINGYWTWEKVADMLPYDYKP
ncbi:carboxypeptidase-like regulatory domain-containing protein [Ferruginibacter lapsinanis]|uniref:carboxypeptidase-like regulatory domain-containing protein n=1 Tax=Ferruginibacter lapsinanis TaxID=563172 RepID=UPI001E51AF29|nr:carboxypeptidase-like regulatory domain-containing protein [Ferruginibacter lapsinanis]UEG51029.1 carboxypeptidase-like regulatory domain-containing protein [Ferruginibacter lapsinanis]